MCGQATLEQFQGNSKKTSCYRTEQYSTIYEPRRGQQYFGSSFNRNPNGGVAIFWRPTRRRDPSEKQRIRSDHRKERPNWRDIVQSSQFRTGESNVS